MLYLGLELRCLRRHGKYEEAAERVKVHVKRGPYFMGLLVIGYL